MRTMAALLPLWAACGGVAPAHAPAAPTAPATAPPTTAPVIAPPPRAPACDGAHALVVVQPTPIAARWSRHTVAAGEGPIEVRWCGAGTIAIRELVVGEDGGAQWIRSYDPGTMPVRDGEVVTLVARGLPHRGQQPATLVATDDRDRELRVAFTIASIDDPARTAAIAACDACHGSWGTVGLAATETCDCPTTDGGRRCRSDADCEGACILTGWEPTARVGEFDRCAPGEHREQLVGRCHARHHAFGCRPRVSEARDRCVRDGAVHGDRLPTLCAD